MHCAAALVGYGSIFPPGAEKPTPALLASGWRDLLATEHARVLVATDRELVVGCVAIVSNDDVPSGCLLARLYVEPAAWGRGIGAALHDAALTVAANQERSLLNLWVLEGNARARAMYERRGWRLVAGAQMVNGDVAPSVYDVLYERTLRFTSSGASPTTRSEGR